jgi:hypothetical protein
MPEVIPRVQLILFKFLGAIRTVHVVAQRVAENRARNINCNNANCLSSTHYRRSGHTDGA